MRSIRRIDPPLQGEVAAPQGYPPLDGVTPLPHRAFGSAVPLPFQGRI